MPYLTTRNLQDLARRRAEELVKDHLRLPDLSLQAAVLYGAICDPGAELRSDARDINLLEIGEPPHVPGMFDPRRLGFEVTQFPSSRHFLIPGVLRIIVTTWPEFLEAARNLHPEVIQMFGNRHEILHAQDQRTRDAITAEIRRAEKHSRRLAGTDGR